MAGDWKPDRPADNEKLNNVGVVCRENWESIENAWNGDHETLETTGSDSDRHNKVTLVSQAAPSAAAGAGLVYVDSAANNDLIYAWPSGGSYSTVNLTQSGWGPGSLKAAASFNPNAVVGTNATIVGNALNVPSVGYSGVGRYIVDVTAGVLTSANYIVQATAHWNGHTQDIYSMQCAGKGTTTCTLTCVKKLRAELTNVYANPYRVDVLIYQR